MILGYKNKTDLTSFGLNLMAVIVLIRGWKMFKLKNNLPVQMGIKHS